MSAQFSPKDSKCKDLSCQYPHILTKKTFIKMLKLKLGRSIASSVAFLLIAGGNANPMAFFGECQNGQPPTEPAGRRKVTYIAWKLPEEKHPKWDMDQLWIAWKLGKKYLYNLKFYKCGDWVENYEYNEEVTCEDGTVVRFTPFGIKGKSGKFHFFSKKSVVCLGYYSKNILNSDKTLNAGGELYLSRNPMNDDNCHHFRSTSDATYGETRKLESLKSDVTKKRVIFLKQYQTVATCPPGDEF